MKSDDIKSKRKKTKKIEAEDEEGNNKKMTKIQTLKEQEQGHGSLRSCSNNIKVPRFKGIAKPGSLKKTIRKRPKRKTIINQKITQLYYNIKKNKNKRKLNNIKINNKGSCSALQNNTQSPIPIYNKGDVVDLYDLLFTPDRDFLITYKDRDCTVQAKHLEGKVVVLHFLPLVPWRSDSGRMYETTILRDVYHLLQPQSGFEVVFIGVNIDNPPPSNPDNLYLNHPTLEECFEDKLSIMPWSAISFPGVKSKTYWESIFPLSCFLYSKSLTYVVIDPKGRVSQCDANKIFFVYGARAYLFTSKKLSRLEFEDHKAQKHPSITELLASPGRNHLINNKNQVVPLHNLEDKVVGLYFFEVCDYYNFTQIREAYEILAKEKNFEIVLVYIHDGLFTFKRASEESYWESFKTMPWLALPYKDPACKRLQGVFSYPMDNMGPGTNPSLLIIGPQGKFVERYGADILMNYGISAFPFTRYSVVKLEAKHMQKASLNMFWRRSTYYIRKDWSLVDFSQLVGKKIILVVENNWYHPHAKFWQMLRTRYLQMKGTNNEFEVIHICRNRKRYSYGKNMATMSWMRHPHGYGLGRRRCLAHMLVSKFFDGVFGLFAFDHDGRLVRRTTRPSIERRYVGFPFGDMEKDLLRKVVEKYEWDS